jgi:hypothetical protein
MLKRRGYRLILSGRGIRVVRGLHYAKLSDLLPPKLSAKRLTQRWGMFRDYWAKTQRQSVRQKHKKRQKQRLVELKALSS